MTRTEGDYRGQKSNGITQDNFDDLLRDFAKEFKKQNGSKTPAEIIIVGGASIVSNYGFRNATQDIDVIARGSSAIKDAILRISDSHNLPPDWMNSDFIRTSSYSDKIIEFSEHYRTYYGGLLEVRTVKSEYLIAMKMMSGRLYKHDFSDIVGILLESKEHGHPISFPTIEKAIIDLYGNTDKIKPTTIEKVREYTAMSVSDLTALYESSAKDEARISRSLLSMDKKYIGLINKDTVEDIVSKIQAKINGDDITH